MSSELGFFFINKIMKTYNILIRVIFLLCFFFSLNNRISVWKRLENNIKNKYIIKYKHNCISTHQTQHNNLYEYRVGNYKV